MPSAPAGGPARRKGRRSITVDAGSRMPSQLSGATNQSVRAAKSESAACGRPRRLQCGPSSAAQLCAQVCRCAALQCYRRSAGMTRTLPDPISQEPHKEWCIVALSGTAMSRSAAPAQL
jgi:hypothetical protein